LVLDLVFDGFAFPPSCHYLILGYLPDFVAHFFFDMAIQHEVFGFIDRSRPAATEPGEDAIVLNSFVYHGCAGGHAALQWAPSAKRCVDAAAA